MGGVLPVQTTSVAFVSSVTAECPICLQPYDSDQVVPKMTKCGHTACSACLEQMKSDDGSICSICKTIDPENINNLPTNYAILQVNENQNNSNICVEHGHEFGCYCKKDNKLLCWCCVEGHSNHKCIPLNSSKIEKIIDKITRKFLWEEDFLLEKVEEIEHKRVELRKYTEDVEKALQIHVDALNKTREDLITKLNYATDECIKKVEKIYKKSKIIDADEALQAAINDIKNEHKKVLETKEKYEKSPKEKKLLYFKMRTLKHKKWELPSVGKFFSMLEELKEEQNYSENILAEFEKILM